MPLDPELEPHLAEAARLNNLDPLLLKALLSGESSLNSNATSPAGAEGIAQIMPGTARQYKIADPYDPVQGIYGGARILNDALTNAEQLKASGRDIVPVEYALKTYFAGPEGPQWGPKTDAYPGYIASKYQAAPKQDNSQPGGVGQLAAAGASQVKTNAIGEQYQQDGEGGWHLVGNPQGRAAVRALTPSSPGYAATRGPGNDVGINISPLTGKPYQDPPLSPADPLNGNGKPYVVPDNFPQERGAQIKTGAGMDGIDQLAAAGQPQPAGDMPPGVMQLAQAGQGGMSDEALLKGFVDGTLPFMQKPAATPAAAPQAPPAAAQTPTPAPTQPPQSTAAPALDVPGLIDTYNRYRSFPAGLPLAQGALGMLQKMAPEGYVLGQDGSISLRPGFAQGANTVKANEAAGTHLQNIDQNGVVSNMPGAVSSAAEVKKAETTADKSAAAPFTAVQDRPGSRTLTIQDLVDMRNGKTPEGMKPGDLPGIYNDPGVAEATKSNEALYKEYAGIVANNPIAEQNLRNAAEAFRFFQSGAGAELSAKAGAWMKAAGIDPQKLNLNDPAKVEEAKKAATQAIFAQMAGLKNPALGEYGMLESASAQPTLQPEAAKMIMGNSLAKLAYQNDFFQHMANHRTEHGSMMGYDPSSFISGAAQLMPGYQDAAMKSLPTFKGEGPAPPPAQPGNAAAKPGAAAIEQEMRRRGLLK